MRLLHTLYQGDRTLREFDKFGQKNLSKVFKYPINIYLFLLNYFNLTIDQRKKNDMNSFDLLNQC